MILRLIIENFLSFREQTQFDLFPNQKGTLHPAHVYADGVVPVLKQTAIYGANGSGKSNLVKAFSFIKGFATTINYLDTISLGEYVHRLDSPDTERPIELLLEFETQGHAYIYSIKISQEAVEEESLYHSGLGQQPAQLIYSRKRDRLAFAQEPVEVIKKHATKLVEANRSSSVMSLNRNFPIFGASCEEAWKWMNKDFRVIESLTLDRSLISYLDAHGPVLEFAQQILRKSDLGITDFFVKTEDYDQWIGDPHHHRYGGPDVGKGVNEAKSLNISNARTPLYDILMEQGQKVVKELSFHQEGRGGQVLEMGIRAQSEGTQRILNLLPALYAAMHEGKTVVVDEIESSLHPILIRDLVKLFAQASTNGQLVFTTHQTCLLDQQALMRPDEIWFSEKEQGATRLYSLNDYNIHSTPSLEQDYLQGRYGAIPYPDDFQAQDRDECPDL